MGLVQVETTSDYLSANRIIYDRNPGYGYYFIGATSAPASSLTLSISTPDPTVITSASKIYYLYIDITTSISSDIGNFTIALYYDSSVHLSGSAGLMDFRFVGDCEAEAACPTCSIPTLEFCDVDVKLETLTFSMSTVTAGQTIRIRAEVENPVYSSVRGLRVFWVDSVSGAVMERGQVVAALTVSAIPLVDLLTDRVYFLWGLEAGYTDANIAGVNIGLYAASTASPLIGPLNSFNLGFSISSTSPITAIFNVKFKIFAKGIL